MKPKALPPAKISSAKLLKGSPVLSTVKKISTKSIRDDSRQLELGIVKKQVIQIGNLIKTNTLLKAKEEERKKKESEKRRFAEKEEKLEQPKEDRGDKVKLPSLPRIGFLERIKKFLFSIFLGYISLRLLPYLPKLAGVVDTIIKVQDVVIDVSGKILNGLVSFVDKAYEVHDKTRKFLGNLGGENFTKAFDGFIGAMDKVIMASIVAAIAFSELDGGPDSRKKGGPLKSGKELYKEYDRKRALIRKNHGEAAARIYDNEIANGKTPKQALDNLKRKYLSTGKITSQRALGISEIKGSKLFDRGIDKVSGRLTTRILGRSGKTLILKTVKPFLKRLPIIGALIDFGLSVALGEDPGRAAFKAIGAGLLGSVGAAVGSLAFGFGGIVGGILGSIGGDAIGGALYDMFFGNKKPQSPQVQGRAQGGPITRGGKYTGPVKRTIKKSQAKRTIAIKPTEVKPGQSVGGKDKIEKVFPETEQKNKSTTVNPLGYMKSSHKTVSSIPGLGELVGILMKAQLGQRASNADYQSAADGLTAWMQNTLGGGIQRTGGAFASGGEVDVGMFSNSDDMRTVIAKAVQDSVAPKVDDILNDLKKQLDLKAIKEQAPSMPGPGEQPAGLAPTGGTLTMEQLVGIAKGAGFNDDNAVIAAAIAMAESGGDSSAHNTKPPDNSYGLWQINMIGNLGPARREQYGLSNNEQLFDPVTNAKIAFKISGGSNFSPWTTYTKGNYKSHLAAAQSARGASPLKTSPVMTGGKGMDGYITGDPSSPNYDSSHGGNNYHDHLSFRDRATAEKAYRFFNSKGFKITEFMGYGAGVTGPHSGPGSLHHRGLAFDIPGSQVPVGQEIQMSSRVRSALSEFKSMKMFKGGKVKGKMGIDQIRAMLTHGEFVLDVNSTKALEENYPGFLDALNKADYQGALNVLRSYASYEQGATIRAFVDEKIVPVPIPVSSSQQSSMMISLFDEIEDYMASSYKG